MPPNVDGNWPDRKLLATARDLRPFKLLSEDGSVDVSRLEYRYKCLKKVISP